MERRDVVDAEFQVVEPAWRIRWGSVAWHSFITICMAFWAMNEPEPIIRAVAVMTAAIQWPLSRLFSGLLAPRLPPEQVELLAERLRRGTPVGRGKAASD